MRVRKLLVVAVLVASAAAVGVFGPPGPAGACSFAGSQLEAPDSVPAGGTLTVSGTGFFDIDGDVGPDCSGDYEFVPRTGVVVEVRFETFGDPVVVRVPAPVAGEEDDFAIGPFEVAVPADARSATVSTGPNSQELAVEVTGGVAEQPDPPTPPTPPPAAPPAAAPVAAEPTYTG